MMNVLKPYPKNKLLLSCFGILFVLASVPAVLLLERAAPSLKEGLGYLVLLIGLVGFLCIVANTIFAAAFYFRERKRGAPHFFYLLMLCMNGLILVLALIYYRTQLAPTSAPMQVLRICSQRAEVHYVRVEYPLNDAVGKMAAGEERDALFLRLDEAREEGRRIYQDCMREHR